MEAKDTVMNFKQMNLLRSTPAVAEAQAEISFPLGKQEGMQEVAEAIKAELFRSSYMGYLRIDEDWWQAFLKERGLEK